MLYEVITVRLGGLLHQRTGALPVLLGGPGETRLAERYAAEAGHLV